ncbi:MAG: 3-phosphoshikimate 1-carboxyvinyltransferase [Candidatus Firestonebacteria bacterium]
MRKNINLIIKKIPRLIGVIKAPPSKSYTQRAIIIGSIHGRCKIVNPLYSNDTLATIHVCQQLGAVIKRKSNCLYIVKGFYGLPRPKSYSINVGESGTLLRFILPILALVKGNFKIQGQGTLLNRSNMTIVEALRSWNIQISGIGKSHKVPIRLKGSGEIKGGRIYVSGIESSQAISSLLIASPFAKNNTTIIVKDRLVSSPYVDITIDVLQQAGIKVKNEHYKKFYVPCNQKIKPQKKFIIHGDYSSSAFLIVAACLLPSDITITDLIDDKQGDKKIVDILNMMGAKIKCKKNTVRIKGPFVLKGMSIDCSSMPDLVPILTVVGCFAKGKTKIYNISHLVHKESNRITTSAGELMKLGANISTTKDSITVKQSYLKPGCVCSCNDHRIAMALLVAGLKIGNIRIESVNCISKSYPDFLKNMKSIGAKFKDCQIALKVCPIIADVIRW